MPEVKIKVGDIEMSVEEAREMYIQLKQVFGADDPVSIPYYPTPWELPQQPFYNPWGTTSGELPTISFS